MSLGGAAGLIELVAGGLIVLGLFTRPAAFLASGTMAVAYWMVHAPQSPYPIVNGGELDTSLLGMSYLSRHEVTFSGDRMILRR